MRIGIILSAMPGARGAGPQALAGLARQAEEMGFASLWLNQVLEYDALTVLALAGQSTQRLELGTAVVPTYPRHPAVLAQQALTVHLAVGHRLTLGVGLSHRVVIEGMYGLSFAHPLRHIREYLTILRALLTERRARLEGREYRVDLALRLPEAPPPGLLLAALGPQMLQVAGEMTDGTVVWLGGPRYLADFAVPLLRQSARSAGRPEPRVVASLPVAVTSAVEPARAAARRFFGFYGDLPSYRAVLDREGVAGPEEVALIGDEGTVEQGLRRLAEAGATDFAGSPFPVREDPEAHARTVAFLADLARRGTG